MKPLIQAIPKKTIIIMGKEYEIYKCITFAVYSYKQDHFEVRISSACTGQNKRKRFSISSSAVEKYGRGIIDETLDKLSEIVEINYVKHFGLKLSDLKARIGKNEQTIKNCVYVYFYYSLFDFPSGRQFSKNKLGGNKKIATEEQINLRLQECIEHQRIHNTEYNIKASQYNKELAELIQKQIQERDHIYFQKKQS